MLVVLKLMVIVAVAVVVVMVVFSLLGVDLAVFAVIGVLFRISL